MLSHDLPEFRYFPCGGEITPFIFKGKKRLLINYSALNGDLPKGEPDHARMVDPADNRVLSSFMEGHYFMSAFVVDGKCWCFGSEVGCRGTWKAVRINSVFSEDLIHWSQPKLVMEYPSGHVFNTAAAFDGKRYVLLYETDDPKYPKFTFKFLESPDLIHWKEVENAIYGQDKYVGGPAMYYLPDGYFYVTYVNSFRNPENGHENWDTRIARSRDLIHWEEGSHPVISPDYSHQPDPEHHPDVFEINASDAEFLEENGKTTVYCNGGNQMGISDSAISVFNGTMQELFLRFFP